MVDIVYWNTLRFRPRSWFMARRRATTAGRNGQNTFQDLQDGRRVQENHEIALQQTNPSHYPLWLVTLTVVPVENQIEIFIYPS